MKGVFTALLFFVTILPLDFLRADAPFRKFRARFWHQEKLVELNQVSGRLGDQSFTTDSNGEILIDIPDTSQLRLIPSRDWKVLYPVNGLIPIPGDENIAVDIHLAPIDESPVQAQLLATFSMLEQSYGEDRALLQDKMEELVNSQTTELERRFADQLKDQILLYQEIKDENDRREAQWQAQRVQRINAGRSQVHHTVSTLLDHFISRARDLKDEFEFRQSQIFRNYNAIQDINDKIEGYSEAYEQLNAARDSINYNTARYWDGDCAMIYESRSLLDFALDILHKDKMLSARPLCEDINNYILAERKSERRRKEEIQADIDSFTYSSEKMIETLERRKTEVIKKMEENRL